MDIKQEKARLRKEYKAKRDEINNGRSVQAAKLVCETLEYKNAKSVFCYVSFKSEISTKILAEQILKDKKALLVPRTFEQGKMEAVRIYSLSDLVLSKFGIPEPKPEFLSKNEKIDLAIVPGLAFDKSGARLGYGGGYYDRFLKNNKIFSIGLCHKELLAEKLPKEDFDVCCSKICAV